MNAITLCKQLLIPLLGISALTGCTSVRVQPVGADNRIEHVCIQENPKVQVGDFVSVMQEGFQSHGISSQVVRDHVPSACRYTSTYTARRTWDMAMYMTDAQIDIQRDGRQIASANYHLKGKGGFALNKWAGTRSKILPVIDQLLAQVPSTGRIVTSESNSAAAIKEPQAVAVPTSTDARSDLGQRLASLKDAYDAQLITKEEYDAKRKELLEKF